MNAACRPIGAQIEPRRRNSQPRASATGTRTANPMTARPRASPAVGAGDRQDVDDREEQGAPDERPPRSQVARPGRRREAAEQDLLADRRDDRAGQQVEERSPVVSPVGGSGLTGWTGSNAPRMAATGSVTTMTGRAHSAPPTQVATGPARRTGGCPSAPRSARRVSTTSRRMSADVDERLGDDRREARRRDRRPPSRRAPAGRR